MIALFEKSALTVLLVSLLCASGIAASTTAKSPSGRIEITVLVDTVIRYAVKKDNALLIAPSEIALHTNTEIVPGIKPKLKSVKKESIEEKIDFVVPRKFRSLTARYTRQLLEFVGGYGLEIRAYDEGVAYRWITALADPVVVRSETANFLFPGDCSVWFPEEASMYSHQERTYRQTRVSEIAAGKFSTPAALFEAKGCKFMIVEADLRDYCGMYIEANGKDGFRGKFPGVPLETIQTSDRDVKVAKTADHIAQTAGNRSYPWRAIIVADTDADLLVNELVFKLASPLELKDVSWIKPGKVAWDWWNANNIYGVDFPSGINTATYKYFIDFASAHSLEYIILDEGWYHLENALKIKEAIDVKELIRYGREKGVGIILWVTWKALADQLDKALAEYASWGAAGVKVDFMQRDDQWMVNYYWRVAKKAAELRLLVDFHGAYKPTGIRRAYPNVITQEGVLGLEHCKWSDDANPLHNTILPFTRMVLGPMDYTPGAMKNAGKENFRIVFSEPMSSGTRCHQLALYVAFESPLQMLADNPSNYLREPECLDFLAQVPVTWDKTVPLAAKIGEYLAVARENNGKWYIGAITNWDKRALELDFSFLPKGHHTLTLWKDGINADKHASDYKKEVAQITHASKVMANLAPGGGWVGIIEPAN